MARSLASSAWFTSDGSTSASSPSSRTISCFEATRLGVSTVVASPLIVRMPLLRGSVHLAATRLGMRVRLRMPFASGPLEMIHLLFTRALYVGRVAEGAGE